MKFDKQTLIKFGVKTAIGFVVSAGIGYAIKGERHLGGLIDAYFDKSSDTTAN